MKKKTLNLFENYLSISQQNSLLPIRNQNDKGSHSFKISAAQRSLLLISPNLSNKKLSPDPECRFQLWFSMRVAVHTSSTFCLRGLSTNMLGARKAATRERAGERRKLNLVRRILCFSSSSSSALPEERALSRARRRAVCALIVPAPTHPPPPTHSGPFVVSGAHNSFLASLVARSPTCHARPGKVGGWLCTIGCSARAATGENKNQLPFRPFSVARERERSRAPHAK